MNGVLDLFTFFHRFFIAGTCFWTITYSN